MYISKVVNLETAKELVKLLYIDILELDRDQDLYTAKLEYKNLMYLPHDDVLKFEFISKMADGTTNEYEISKFSIDTTFDNHRLVLHNANGPLASFTRGAAFNCLINTHRHVIELDDWIVDD